MSVARAIRFPFGTSEMNCQFQNDLFYLRLLIQFFFGLYNVVFDCLGIRELFINQTLFEPFHFNINFLNMNNQ